MPCPRRPTRLAIIVSVCRLNRGKSDPRRLVLPWRYAGNASSYGGTRNELFLGTLSPVHDNIDSADDARLCGLYARGGALEVDQLLVPCSLVVFERQGDPLGIPRICAVHRSLLWPRSRREKREHLAGDLEHRDLRTNRESLGSSREGKVRGALLRSPRLCGVRGQEAEQLRHDPLVGVLLGEVAGVLELRHLRVRQGLAP
jgi:hypothetical protein